ncbi:MAG: hypothetical protein WBA54_07575, partial [Acidaminobacteraceae bacterium]
MIEPMKIYLKNISTFNNIIGLKVGNTPFIYIPYGGYTPLSYNQSKVSEEVSESNIYYNVNNQIDILNNYKDLKITSAALKTNLSRISNDISNYKKITDVKKKINNKTIMNEENNNSKNIDLFEHMIISLKMNNMFTNVINNEQINLKKSNLMNLSSEKNSSIIRNIFRGSINNYIDYRYKKDSQKNETSKFLKEILNLNMLSLSSADNEKSEINKNGLSISNSKTKMNLDDVSNTDTNKNINSINTVNSINNVNRKKYLNYISSKLILQKYLNFEVLGSKTNYRFNDNNSEYKSRRKADLYIDKSRYFDQSSKSEFEVSSTLGVLSESNLNQLIEKELFIENYKNNIINMKIDIENGIYDEKISMLFKSSFTSQVIENSNYLDDSSKSELSKFINKKSEDINIENNFNYESKLEENRDAIKRNLVNEIIKNAIKKIYVKNPFEERYQIDFESRHLTNITNISHDIGSSNGANSRNSAMLNGNVSNSNTLNSDHSINNNTLSNNQ